MTGPDTSGNHPTRELPPQPPSVSTAPPSGLRRWWAKVPHHLGRARTSTVVLVVLFLAIGTLYLYVRPEVPATATTVGTGGSTAPVQTTAPAEPTKTTRPTTTAPTTTPSDTTGPGPTTETPPEGTAPGETSPEETTGRTPTTSAEPTTTPAPTRATPTAGAPTP